MTTYAHTITLTDSERIALEAALNLMSLHCDEQMTDGPRAPSWEQHECLVILMKLAMATPVMMST